MYNKNKYNSVNNSDLFNNNNIYFITKCSSFNQSGKLQIITRVHKGTLWNYNF